MKTSKETFLNKLRSVLGGYYSYCSKILLQIFIRTGKEENAPPDLHKVDWLIGIYVKCQ